jgi:HSP20 family protein
MNKLLAAAVCVLIMLVAGQAYYTYTLHQKLDRQLAYHEKDNSRLEDHSGGTQSHRSGPSLSFNHHGRNQAANDWSPFEEIRRLHEEMNQMFGSSFSRFGSSPLFDGFSSQFSFSPQVNIEELDDSYVVSVSIPGAEEASITTRIEDGMLHISGETNRSSDNESNKKGGAYMHRERYFGSFQRSVPLPSDINESKTSTDYKNGVLTIEISKVKEKHTNSSMPSKLF